MFDADVCRPRSLSLTAANSGGYWCCKLTFMSATTRSHGPSHLVCYVTGPRARKFTHWYRAASDCFFVRNTGRTDDAVVIMVIMMQQHTNIYKLHLAARLTASSGRDYVTHCPLLGDGVGFRRTLLRLLLVRFRNQSVMKQYGHVVTSRFQLTADCRSACLLCITSPCSHAVVTLR